MVKGFKFGLGFAVAALLVFGVGSVGSEYGRCALAIDAGRNIQGQGPICDLAVAWHKAG